MSPLRLASGRPALTSITTWASWWISADWPPRRIRERAPGRARCQRRDQGLSPVRHVREPGARPGRLGPERDHAYGSHVVWGDQRQARATGRGQPTSLTRRTELPSAVTAYE